MYKLFIYTIIIFSQVVYISKALSCMPVSPEDVFIGRYGTVHQKKLNSVVSQPYIQQPKFIFRSFVQNLYRGNPKEIQSTLPIKGFREKELMIGLAYAADGRKVNQYHLLAFAKLSCTNDQIKIAKVTGDYLYWNRVLKTCQSNLKNPQSLLNGFISHNEVYYLERLRNKFPTCEKLYQAFR